MGQFKGEQPVILLGSATANPWAEVFRENLTFAVEIEPVTRRQYVANHAPLAGRARAMGLDPGCDLARHHVCHPLSHSEPDRQRLRAAGSGGFRAGHGRRLRTSDRYGAAAQGTARTWNQSRRPRAEVGTSLDGPVPGNGLAPLPGGRRSRCTRLSIRGLFRFPAPRPRLHARYAAECGRSNCRGRPMPGFFKKYSQMKVQMKREALARLNR
jgi:hypothetical protein